MKIIGGADWKHPLVRAKDLLAAPAKQALAMTGRWEQRDQSERETLQADAIAISGDRPEQRRRVYKNPRPEFTDAGDILYTPQGLAVQNGRYIDRYSIRQPSTMELLKPPSRGVRAIAQGTVIESETPYTYGDWVGDFVLALTTSKNIIGPLVLPAFLAKKSYVIRDVEALGVAYVVADDVVRIEQARVLRKRIPSYYWGPEQVAAYRSAFGVNPPPARKGSILYLGRYDTVSEAAQRRYPTETVARIVGDIGGAVFDTRAASPDKFDELAPGMETVVADQGSALFGVMHAQTKNVIELAQDHWWHNASPFFAYGAGVENYAVIHLKDKDEAELRRRIEGHLKEFGVL